MWKCPRCETINDATHEVCEVCFLTKPEQSTYNPVDRKNGSFQTKEQYTADLGNKAANKKWNKRIVALIAGVCVLILTVSNGLTVYSPFGFLVFLPDLIVLIGVICFIVFIFRKNK